MNILTISIRNSRRKPLRTLLLIAVFTLGVTSVVSLGYVSRVVGESLEKKLLAFGANILVTPKAETLTVSYGGFSLGDLQYDVRALDVADMDSAVDGIELTERISAVAPKLVAMAEVSPETSPAPASSTDGPRSDAPAEMSADGTGKTHLGVIGVRWQDERRIKNHWAVNGDYPEDAWGVVVGAQVARRLNLAPGSTLRLFGHDFTVTGVLFPTGSDDDSVVLADIATLQQVTDNPGQATFVEVAALCAGCPISDIVDQLAKAMPQAEIKALQSVVKQRMFTVLFVQNLVLGVGAVILLTGCAMVGLSMLSSVNERKKEIGVLRSLGFSKSGVFAIFSFEAMIIGMAAGLLGYIGGYAASFRILELLDVVEDAGVAFDPLHFAATGLVVAAVSVLSAAFPAHKASRIRPTEALVSL